MTPKGAAFTTWYVCKYVTLPGEGNPVGSRGFRLMAEIVKRGGDCVIITSDSNHLVDTGPEVKTSYASTSIEGVTVTTLRTFQSASAASWRRIVSWLDFEWRLFRFPVAELPHPDVIVVSSLSLFTIANGVRLRQQLGARLVFEVRDIWPLTLTEEGGFSRRNPLIRMLGALERWGYRSADAIVGTMPNLGEHVAEVLGEARDVTCIPMGVTDNQLAPITESATLREEWAPAGAFVVTYAGTIGLTNALETLMLCAQQLAADGNDSIHFVILGDGDLRSKYVTDFGDLTNLTFVPKVPRDEVQQILTQSDVLYFAVHPSDVWRFGQSLNKLIDYMLSGRPVIASYTGYPSMVDEARCGVFVPAGDVTALKAEVLRFSAMPPEVLQSMGARGKAWLSENRRFARLAQDYLRVLNPSARPLGGSDAVRA